MSQPNKPGRWVVVTTNQGDYYVIPVATLEQFRATAEQRAQIDTLAADQGTGFYSQATAAEESARPDFASAVVLDFDFFQRFVRAAQPQNGQMRNTH